MRCVAFERQTARSEISPKHGGACLGKGETEFLLVISLYLFAQLELCFPWWFGSSSFCLLPINTSSFLLLFWSLPRVSQLGEDILGAILTAPSREQCWPSLPHQRVQQVPLLILHKALVLGTWFLVERQLCTECPPHESACSQPGCPFQEG